MKNDTSGILLLDKPFGVTSNDALQEVKHLMQMRKAGHTGSLDPIATGMLPLCFNEATKFSQFLLEADKTYLVAAKFGIATNSGDSEGKVIATRSIAEITLEKIAAVLPQFRGKIMQLPPMFSAIKHNGEPLYKLARQGIEVERKLREISVYEFQLNSYADGIAHFLIKCSKGTYVRTLVTDIGELLQCGAHVVELRRLEVGPFKAAQMVMLSTLRELVKQNAIGAINQLILPIETMLVGLPEISLTPDMFFYMQQGQALLVPKAPSSGYVILKNKNGKFVGVGEVSVDDGRIIPRRLVKFNSSASLIIR